MLNIFKEFIVLENSIAKIIPLDRDNSGELSRICYDDEIWNYMETRISDATSLQTYVEAALNQRALNETYPLIVYVRRREELAGCTRFGLINTDCDSIEIGWSWFGKRFRGTGVNLACKHLLLKYAFEFVGVNRVSFSAAKGNMRSRRAIEKIGGRFEGVLREIFRDADGAFHDLAVFSILKSEWAAVDANLTEKISQIEAANDF